MAKRLVIGLALAFSVMLPAHAHLTGAFADFLAIVYDETTIDGLKKELARTKEQITELEPEVDANKSMFEENQQLAVEQLQLYTDSGLDVWLSMMENDSDAADLLGSQWQVERGIDAYLDSLNELYLHYQQLKSKQQSLKGHEKLLAAIEKNLLAREQYLKENAELPLDQIANYLDIDWVSEVEYELIDDLKADQERIHAELGNWLAVSEDGTLEESWVNENSQLQYFFRKDHIYAEYELEYAHVILLGQVLQKSDGKSAELVFEAGFYNGFYLPEELLEELQGFKLDYAAFRKLTGIEKPYFTQTDGVLQIHRK
ncbi:hypothetical protein HF394_17870 [Planococcus glaciei]|uniref:SbsC C-terminal domain-containing protein n=1 Tax=Planococcus glaciei TaxID=459472 RepID=A0A7H8QE53_9BACL|nr:hypothetical protein [Planococcus glaciei]QDY46628.1 hypothetical protein FK545_18640 [Planococcus glaciei]QKX52288.1 hypothetical protein HF394_17870 [Planococcus glaciei]